jgi:hypothetical protein
MATWNTDNPKVGNQVSADIADIEENLQELHDVIEAITSGTLGTTTAADFEVDTLADGTTGFASTTTQPFYQNSAPTGWTRNSALTDNSMFMYAAAGNVAAGGAVDAKAAHTHSVTPHEIAVQFTSGGNANSADITPVTSGANTAPYYIEMILAAVD